MSARRALALMGIVLVLLVIVGQVVKTSPVASQSEPPSIPTDGSEQAIPEGFPEGFEGFPESGEIDGVAATSGISALGSVMAAAEVSISFQSAGTVEGVYVQTGNYVEAGEVLADLDSTDAWEAYNQALLNLESAELSMVELLAPPTEAELAVAQANVTSAQASYGSTANPMSEEELQSLQMQYDQKVAQLEALEYERWHSDGSDEEIALMEAQIGAATFNTEIARLQLEEQTTPDSNSLWSASIRVQEAQLQLEQLQEEPEQSEIDNAQLTIDRAQTTVTNAQDTLLKTQLVAPRSGYVMAVNIEQGQSVDSQEVAIEIADLSQLQITVPVNELDIGQVQEGMNATIELEALPDVEIQGTVDGIGWLSETSSDGIVTYDVRIVLNTTDSRVLSGMTGEVVIETAGDLS